MVCLFLFLPFLYPALHFTLLFFPSRGAAQIYADSSSVTRGKKADLQRGKSMLRKATQSKSRKR